MTGKPLRLLSVGKLKVPFWKDAAAHYSQRINRWRRLECVEVRDGDPALPQAQRNELEGRRLLEALGPQDVPLVLDELSECVSGQEDAEGAVEARELRRLLDQFIRELPAREGNIFLRRYFFTEPVGEIARRWGLTENHVSVLLSRTRKKLKALLEKEGYL